MIGINKSKWYVAASTATAAFFLYLPSLRNQFAGVWDDNAYVFENNHIRSLDADFFRWAFFEFHASNWHPVTWVSHAVDYAIWGLNPLGHHLTSVFLHAVNTFLVVILVIMLLEAAKGRSEQTALPAFLKDRSMLITAVCTGFLFGFHPLHVESVAWVAERKDLLCAFFFLLSITAYMNYARAEDRNPLHSGLLKSVFRKHYLRSLAFFILALFSKPMAVTLPLVLLILDWYPTGRIRDVKTLRPALLEKAPFIAFSLASSIITVMAQKSGESIISVEHASLSIRLLVAAKALALYIRRLVMPVDLAAFYPYPKDVSIFFPEYLFALLFIAGVTILFIRRKQQFWISSWGYYVVTLIPVLGIVQVGSQSMADRYMYLPSVGPFLMAGIATAWTAERLRRGRKARFAFAAASIMLASILSAATVRQIKTWQNDFVLWDSVITKGYESATAYNNRGLALDNRGKIDKAAADFDKAIALDPRNYFAFNNRGVQYGRQGRFEESVRFFRRALAINPKYADSYCNLGLSYYSLKQYEAAFQSYDKAIELNKDFHTAYLNRANLHFSTGNKSRAFSDYRNACNLGNGKACEAQNLLAASFLSR